MTAPLKALKHVAQAGGLMGREPFRIMTAQMMGEAAQVVYRDGQGTIDSQILFRDKEAELVILSGGRKWSFEGVVVHYGLARTPTPRRTTAVIQERCRDAPLGAWPRAYGHSFEDHRGLMPLKDKHPTCSRSRRPRFVGQGRICLSGIACRHRQINWFWWRSSVRFWLRGWQSTARLVQMGEPGAGKGAMQKGCGLCMTSRSSQGVRR